MQAAAVCLHRCHQAAQWTWTFAWAWIPIGAACLSCQPKRPPSQCQRPSIPAAHVATRLRHAAQVGSRVLERPGAQLRAVRRGGPCSRDRQRPATPAILPGVWRHRTKFGVALLRVEPGPEVPGARECQRECPSRSVWLLLHLGGTGACHKV